MMSRNRNRSALYAIALLIGAAASFWILTHMSKPQEKEVTTQGPKKLPRCAGLACYDNSDCGTWCDCIRIPGEKLGKCVSKLR